MMTLNIETLIKIKQTNQNQQNKIKQNKNSTRNKQAKENNPNPSQTYTQKNHKTKYPRQKSMNSISVTHFISPLSHKNSRNILKPWHMIFINFKKIFVQQN